MVTSNKYIADVFDIRPFDIYNQIFGYRAIPYPLAASLTDIIPNPVEKLSKLGAALYSKDRNGREAFCPVVIEHKGKKYNLPYSTIAIGMSKIITKTTVVGRPGTVKELISRDDYKFTIRGVILSDEELPEDELVDMSALFKIDEPVSLKNAFAEIFIPQDNKVVIESVDLPDMKGISGAQAYTIEVLSDTVLELEAK